MFSFDYFCDEGEILKVKGMKSLTINYIEGSTPLFEGLINHIYLNTDSSTYSLIITTSESSLFPDRRPSSILIDPKHTSTDTYEQFVTQSIENSNFTISFLKHKVKLQSYSLKSRTDSYLNLPRQWIVEGINDIKSEVIHAPEPNTDLDGVSKEKNYIINNENFYTSFRFTQIGENQASNQNKYSFSMNKVEFFGTIVLAHICTSQSTIHIFIPILFFIFLNDK